MDRTDPMGGAMPLSVGQVGLWLLHKLAPESATYNLAGGVRMAPAPDPVVLVRAVRALTVRHPMLRSVYAEPDGIPSRYLREPGEVSALEIRDVPDADDAELRRIFEAEARRPFRLTEDGAFRPVLLRRENDAVLLCLTHHIATDAISQWTLWRDLLEAYRAYALGDEPGWAPLTSEYQDFVELERALLDSTRGDRQGEYWQEQRKGSVPGELPLDHPRPAISAGAGASLVRKLPGELSEKLKNAAAEQGVSQFAMILGAFQALLHRCSGQTDFLIACPASVRRAAAKDVVGYFVNPILIRGQVDRSSTLSEVMADANERLRQATPRAGYPFPLVVRAAATADPLYRISMTMVNSDHFGAGLGGVTSGDVLEVAGLSVSYLEIPHLEGQCDLSLEVTRDVYGLTVAFRYNTEIFEPETVDRLFGQFVRFLEAAAEDPRRKVSRISLMSDAEKTALLSLSGSPGGGS
ncbi:condensation domain-containing protein [Streptomyces sp. NPDC051322]|uniref:condensation domain-containing protein n=1 Tax=Streptomyces sp. NPDC051322 TaxID=3154645 RepID=UPI00344E542F